MAEDGRKRRASRSAAEHPSKINRRERDQTSTEQTTRQGHKRKYELMRGRGAGGRERQRDTGDSDERRRRLRTEQGQG